MSTYNLKLCWKAHPYDNGMLPVCSAHVELKTYTVDVKGRECISRECMSEMEWDAEIARLKAELDEVHRKGQQHFLAHKLELRRLGWGEPITGV